jgi:membrane protein YdbS with pleckstrin-like domain
MIKIIGNVILFMWNFIFNHEVSPLRHIPDISTRHYVLQILGFMWVVAFSIVVGNATFFYINFLSHVAVIGVITITVSTLTAAKVKPELFKRRVGWGRSSTGEHE